MRSARAGGKAGGPFATRPGFWPNLSRMATEAPLPPAAHTADDADAGAPHTTAGKIADLDRRRHEAIHAGSERAVERQHARGKMTARERIDGLLDPGSFTEFDELARHRGTAFDMPANRPYGDGVVTGYGTIDGRPVCVFSQDFTVFGGSLGEVYGEKLVKGMDHALKTGWPMIGINDGGGARIQEGVAALGLVAAIFYPNVIPSRLVPQLSASLGVSDVEADLGRLMPDSADQAYDMHGVITRILDDGEFLGIHAGLAQNIVVGFGRVEGWSVGVVANQPMHFAGTLDINASEKAARFVRTCDAFSIPVLTFVDVPGFLPGTDQEWGGIIRRGAKPTSPNAEPTAPKITVITRKAYGGAYDVMGSKHLGGDVNLAWPTAQIAVMGAQGAVNILYRRELAAAGSPQEQAALRAGRVSEYEDTLANPYVAADRGYVDAVIRPAETRSQVVRALRTLRTKRQTLPPRKHGNIPL